MKSLRSKRNWAFPVYRIQRCFLMASLLVGCEHGGLHVENDYADPFNHNNDRYYTHGTRFDYIEYEEDRKETYSIGQNLYTPSDKKPTASPSSLSRDRPYAAWLYGEYRKTSVDNSGSLATTYGLQVGCLGDSCAFGKETQQAVHALLGQGKPAWLKSDELKNEPGFIGEYEKRKLVYGNSSNDLIVYGLGKFGNIIDSASLGSTFRAGYNIDSPFDEADPIVFKERPGGSMEGSSWSAYGFATVEERGVLYNQLLEGSLFQSEPHTVRPKRAVTEIDAGLTLGYGMFRFTYMWTRFSTEWHGGHPFAFGGINIEW